MSLALRLPTVRPPRSLSPATAALGLQLWQESRARVDDAELKAALARLEARPEVRGLLDAVFAHSPFLTDCLSRDLETLPRLFQDGPEAALAAALTELAEAAAAALPRAEMLRALRVARRRAALAVALADIAGLWQLDQVIEGLTRVADAALSAALASLLGEAAARGEIAPPADPARPLEGCGYVVLGLGKLGAHELNYSSDVDLIVLYDPAALDYRGSRGVADFCVKLTRDLVQSLSERTADGYAFRTDLRLRPDPGATPLAISFGAAMSYYESMGQNWERAAMIKARPVAGDIALGRSFLAEIRPFVWRKSLDFLAIQDIHSIKRQIYAFKGGARIAIEGHNIKLGRGGIREIEFFAQTQQLIWGGRDPTLRSPRTKTALAALAAAGHCASQTVQELAESYDYLRRLEHRLQMVADQQTHELPKEAAGIAEIAAFLGAPSEAAFREELTFHLRQVEDHYAELFEEAPSLSGPGNLVFTGGEPEPGTVETLTELGYREPERVFNLVRSWHHGRYRATRSTRARELLTEIMPTLLQALGRTADPDQALARFDAFLAGLPAGVQLFGLLAANPRLLDLIAEVMGTAPALADILSRYPGLLDAVLTPGSFAALPQQAALAQELDERLALACDYQDVLDLCRRFANDRKFQAGVHLLQGLADEVRVGSFLSDLADVVIQALLPHVEADFARRHGRFAAGGLAVVALGKLGSREMTAASDLDLVFLYDGALAEQSDGGKPLDPMTYHQRLAQRVINALTVPTGEGVLYQLDMRLRPSGNAGPIATTLEGFRRYHESDAWTWEHMALTRARVVAGPPTLVPAIEAAIRAILLRPREAPRVLADIAAMRQRMARDKPAKGPWDVKLRRGGLVDCEFLAQALQLMHGAAHPELLQGATDRVFAAAAEAGLLPEDEAERLAAATRLWRSLQAYLRLTLKSDFDARAAPEAIRQSLVRAAGALDFTRLVDDLEATAVAVMESYEARIEQPAAAAGAATEGNKT